MRSYLFVPGDAPRKLEKGLASGADALLLDLEDSVAPDAKPKAREIVRDYLLAQASRKDRPRLFVRVNALDTGLTDADLDVVMAARPDGILFPKSRHGGDVTHLDAKITAREALHNIEEGTTRILVLVTESAEALFGLSNYRGSSERLDGMTWGAEDLSADLGAETNRNERGDYTDPYRLARAQCLIAAVAAGVAPIDSIYPNFRDADGLRREALEGRRDGFTGKMAIHPDQVPVINEIYTPSAESIAQAKRLIDAFAAAGNAGVISLDGQMYDQPHLKRALRLLARVKK
ncbi:MAG: CoA ester lyase [Rhizobiales bacterium]|jgi:citrate lyase subunit beta/citryl-CoA lyase|nr:CoA ester lyase [Hyphomicrobiales bacterium]